MTSKRHWSILVALLLVLSLFLAACVRPLPGDGELLSEVAPAVTVGESESEAYPAPEEAAQAEAEVAEAPAEAYPAEESYPAEEATELLQPAQEGESAEAYPGTEGEAAEDEHSEGEAAEGEHTEGEAAEDEAAEGEAAEGEAAEGEATEGEAAEGEAAQVETGRTHTVAPGETLFGIGMKYGMSWVTLAYANDLSNPNSLYVGQVLEIPDVETPDAEATEAETEEAAEATEGEGEEAETEEAAEATEGEEAETEEAAEATEGEEAETEEAAEATEGEEAETEEAAEATEGEEAEAEEAAPVPPVPAIVNPEIPPEGAVLTVYVGSELKECVGVGPQTCMQVKLDPADEYQFFYDQIDGFEYESGYEYVLFILVEPVENPPADASTLNYTLVKEVSKTAVEDAETEEVETEETAVAEETSEAAEETETEETETEETEAVESEATEGQKTIIVGPEKADCEGEGPQTCYLIKENAEDDWMLYYFEIDGLEYEPGYEYELLISETEVEDPPPGASSLTWTLDEVVSKTAVEEAAAEETETEVEEAAAEEVEEQEKYIVQLGDTLASIAYKFGVKIMEIARENDLQNLNQIFAGQELVIPQATDEEAVTSVTVEGTYVVEVGETIFTIAYENGISWIELVEANNIPAPFTLEVGQFLMIPAGE